MTPITLYRTDPTQNMARFYRLDIERDLFGFWCVVREWGRIGRGGRMRVIPYPTHRDAEAALQRQQASKERRGYSVPTKALGSTTSV